MMKKDDAKKKLTKENRAKERQQMGGFIKRSVGHKSTCHKGSSIYVDVCEWFFFCVNKVKTL